jgi:hypothetical protein
MRVIISIHERVVCGMGRKLPCGGYIQTWDENLIVTHQLLCSIQDLDMNNINDDSAKHVVAIYHLSC